jgi:hypothetical protein
MYSHVSFFSRSWKYMAVSLFSFLAMCLKGNKLAVAAVLLIVIIWPSWSHRPLIIGNVEDEFNLVLSTKIPITVLELF